MFVSKAGRDLRTALVAAVAILGGSHGYRVTSRSGAAESGLLSRRRSHGSAGSRETPRCTPRGWLTHVAGDGTPTMSLVQERGFLPVD
jgi:hypothetical protein